MLSTMLPITVLPQLATSININAFIHAIIYLILGLVVAKFISHWVVKLSARYVSKHSTILIRRITFYSILTLFLFGVLQHLGFKLSAVLGAAGILTVAIGFASQTSFSNIISGWFLIAEKSFKLGDLIKIDSISGEVIAIDLLATKIRTAENTLVRIPNEVLLKSAITNLTHFPIRALDLNLKIAYQADLTLVRKILLDIAAKNPLCLEKPSAQISIINFGDSAINLQFSVWAETTKLPGLKNDIYEQIKMAFAANHIEMVFPQVVIANAGS